MEVGPGRRRYLLLGDDRDHIHFAVMLKDQRSKKGGQKHEERGRGRDNLWFRFHRGAGLLHPARDLDLGRAAWHPVFPCLAGVFGLQIARISEDVVDVWRFACPERYMSSVVETSRGANK